MYVMMVLLIFGNFSIAIWITGESFVDFEHIYD